MTEKEVLEGATALLAPLPKSSRRWGSKESADLTAKLAWELICSFAEVDETRKAELFAGIRQIAYVLANPSAFRQKLERAGVLEKGTPRQTPQEAAEECFRRLTGSA